MPYLDQWPKWAARWYRLLHSILYSGFFGAGAFGLTWPSQEMLSGTHLLLIRAGGLLIAVPAFVALVAHVTERWRVEFLVISPMNFGATLYISVILLVAGPERVWLMFTGFIVVAMAAISLRGITLLVFERKTRQAKEGQRRRRRSLPW